jgi:hypothetical protein
LRQVRSDDGDNPIKNLIKMMPERERKEMYGMIELTGNVRLERASFAWVEGAGAGKRDGKIFLRLTGKASQDSLVAAFNNLDRGRMQIKVSKDANGVPITQLQPKFGPIIMLVGNTDMLIVGYERNEGAQDDLVAEVLEARSKKKANPTAGPLKDRLAKIPDKAVALLVGEMPDELKRELGRTFDPLPTKITAFAERGQKGLDLQVESITASNDDADKLVRKVADLRKMGIDELKREMQQPRPRGEPPIPFQAMINVLET